MVTKTTLAVSIDKDIKDKIEAKMSSGLVKKSTYVNHILKKYFKSVEKKEGNE